MTIQKSNLKDISYWLVWLLAAIILYCHFNIPRLNGYFFTNELAWDVFSYYMYLPFTFIYNDIGITNKDVIKHIFDTYQPSGVFYQAYPLENGNLTPNYTCGFAMLYSPFFFIGHLWAKLGNYPQDGWSFPYQFCVANGVMIYILYGLFVLRKVLLIFFNSTVTALTIFFTVLGTNYFHEAFDGYLTAHSIMFTGYAMLLYYTIQWHKEQLKKYVIAAGFVMGIMILARPSELLCVFIPLLWNVYDKESLIKKISLVRSNFPHIIILLVSAFVVFIPQIIYWKVVTGHFIFNSYQRTEGFDFDDPHIFNVLFSFKKSLLVYTPILIFSAIGMILLWKHLRITFFSILLYAAINFYLLSSWAAWWNGGSFGMRYFVESFAVMSIPFGVFINVIQSKKLLVKIPIYLIMLFFTTLNLFQTWQYVNYIIPPDGMTFKYYKRIFFKTQVNDKDRKLLEVTRTYGDTETFTNEHEYQHFTVGYLDFDEINTIVFDETKKDSTQFASAPYSYRMKGNDEWGPMFKFPFNQLVKPDRDHVWLRVSLSYFSDTDIKENPASLVLNMPHKKYNLKYRGVEIEQYPFKKGEWNKMTFDYLTPYPYSEKDVIEIYIWHRGKDDLYFDNICVEAYETKNEDLNKTKTNN